MLPLPNTNSVSLTMKHSSVSKYRLLFDKCGEWISFKPQPNGTVYPCYSCRTMFASIMSLVDHTNRRVILIKYNCPYCLEQRTFYNRCSFLLHARIHFGNEGAINLSDVDVHLLPIHLAGFVATPEIPFISAEANADYYTPSSQFFTAEDLNGQLVTMKPYNLVFYHTTTKSRLILRQIAPFAPKCCFVIEQRQPPPLAVISKVETVKVHCMECGFTPCIGTTLSHHFIGQNRPFDSNNTCGICNYVAPSSCSLSAHSRIHSNKPPHICPECGLDFHSAEALVTHFDDSCFHLTKQVRYKCMAPKCGKIFVLAKTFASHFTCHIQAVEKCSTCNDHFFDKVSFQTHKRVAHDAQNADDMNDRIVSVPCFYCTVCKTIVAESAYKTHIDWHAYNPQRCVYIYTCKMCRANFRSISTYAVHKAKCWKQNENINVITVNCQKCSYQLTFREKETFRTCPQCKNIHYPMNHAHSLTNEEGIYQTNNLNCSLSISSVLISNAIKRIAAIDDNNSHKTTVCCLLCKTEVQPGRKVAHLKVCKYVNPVVVVERLAQCADEDENVLTEPEPEDDISNDSADLNATTIVKRSKRGELDITVKTHNCSILASQSFICRLCNYRKSSRKVFQDHIVLHRDISTAYQCMECGECFVAKPSLANHLDRYHKITDVNTYIRENDCLNKLLLDSDRNRLSRKALWPDDCSLQTFNA